MDLLEQARVGFDQIDIDQAIKKKALTSLQQWLTGAEFVSYRPQVEWLISEKQWAGLLDRFYQILPFGTGGRRGAVGIGPNRMNPWTLAASVQGHCEYLRERFPGKEELSVAIAYDVRRFQDVRRQYNPALPNPVLGLSSKDLAHVAASVYAANGIRVHIPRPESTGYLATPELSFTIRLLRADGGLNISASHNPPDDNGGKFYDERGGQPVPPDDQIMADLVDRVETIRSAPWQETVRSGRILWLDDAPHAAYIDLCRRQSLVPPPRAGEIQVVFTPLHGVGAATAMEALVAQGYRVMPVVAQMTPDGQFPNVTKSPNPEVPESMDRAEATARAVHADVVMATDPDADRLGAMAPDREGKWRFLTGNEIAALLTEFKLARLAATGAMPQSPIVIKTEVTTSLVTRIARAHGAQVVENLLVGFKYIADVLWHLEQHGGYEDVRGTPEDFVIGCEESHGILVTPQIRDKDAAGAAVLLADLTLDQHRQNKNLSEALEALWRKYGYFRNEVVPLVMTGILGTQNMRRMLDILRSEPPREIGGLPVTASEDLRDPHGRMGPLRGATDMAARNVLLYQLGDRGRIALRPSGTEPKAKAYIEISSPPAARGQSEAAWRQACADVDTLIRKVAADFTAKALGVVGMHFSETDLRLSR